MHSTRIRKTGYSTNGLITISATMIAKAISCERENPNKYERDNPNILGSPPKQAARPDEQDDDNHHENHGRRGLRIKDLRQSLDNTQREAGDDRAHDRAHAADDHDGEHRID